LRADEVEAQVAATRGSLVIEIVHDFHVVAQET
jgi:hypothetical protein